MLAGTPCESAPLPASISRLVRLAVGGVTTAVFLATAAGRVLHTREFEAAAMPAFFAAVSFGTVLGAWASPKAPVIVRAHFFAAFIAAAALSAIWLVPSASGMSGGVLFSAFAVGALATLAAAGLTALAASFFSVAESVQQTRPHDGRDALSLGAGIALAWIALPLWAGASLGPYALVGVGVAVLALVRALQKDRARLRFLRRAYEASGQGALASADFTEWYVKQRMPWDGSAPSGVRMLFGERGANLGMLLRAAHADLGPFRESTSEVPAALVPATYEVARRIVVWRYLRSCVSLALASGFHVAFYLYWSLPKR